MDFAFEHRIAAPADEVADTLLDEAYQASLEGVGPLKERRLLTQEKTQNGVTRRVRCVLAADLGAARRFVGNAEPAWVEESVWDDQTRSWSWTIHPEVAQELLSAHGEIELLDKGEETIRRVSGSVKVNVPFYGGRVEKLIVGHLEAAYAEEAEALAGWLGVESSP